MIGTNYIKRDLHITVKDNVSILNESLYLFQNDRNIDLYFTINNVKFDFLTVTQSSENMVEETNAKYSTIRVLKPNGTKIISDSKLPIEDNKVMFTITGEFIDNLDEIGKYKLQISLYDEQDGKITIPHIEFEVLEPIFPEDFIEEYLMGQIDITQIGMSRIAPEIAEASIQEMKNRLADSTGEIQTVISPDNEQLEEGKIFRLNYMSKEKEDTEEYNQINNLDSIKSELIKLSKSKLKEYLEKNPLLSKAKYSEGRYYTVDIEHQSRIASQLLLYQVNTSLGLDYQLTWNDTGNVCEDWTFEELLTLSNEINNYVKPLIKKQQEIEIVIRNATTKEELNNINIMYE